MVFNISGLLKIPDRIPAVTSTPNDFNFSKILFAAFGAKNITVKAIGLIRDNVIVRSNLVTEGRNVKWLHTKWFSIPKSIEKNNVRSNTVYEEFHPEVLRQIIDRLN